MSETFKSYCLKKLVEEDEKLDLKLIEDFGLFSEAKDKFPISIERLVELGIDARKDNALARLKKSFVLGVDFCHTSEKNGTGGRPKKLTNLSIDCFRMLCAQAQNEKGKMMLRSLFAIQRLWQEYSQIQFSASSEEKTQLEIQLNDEKKNLKDIQTKYTRAHGRRYHLKFGYKGPTFYIIVPGIEYADGKPRVKIGICGCKRLKNPDSPERQSIDRRLSNHRVLWPDLQIKFMVYSEDAILLEKMMKRAYRTNASSNSSEMIEGISVDKIIQTCRSILQILNTEEEKSTFKIEDRLDFFNSEPRYEETRENIESESNCEMSSPETNSKSFLEDQSDVVEINHIEYTKSQIQSFLDELPTLNVNGLKTMCRKFRIPLHKQTKPALKANLQTLFQKTLGQLPEEEKTENIASATTEPLSYNPENLPRGISFCKKNGKTLGLKLTVGLGGNVYESTFNDSSRSMTERFQEAIQLQQDLISEFKLTGSVDWENRKRQQVVRLGVCVGCGKEVSKTSSLCQSCASKQDSAIPPKDRLLAMLREHKGNFSAVGRDLQRTDAAVRKWLIGYGFTREEIKNRSFL